MANTHIPVFLQHFESLLGELLLKETKIRGLWVSTDSFKVNSAIFLLLTNVNELSTTLLHLCRMLWQSHRWRKANYMTRGGSITGTSNMSSAWGMYLLKRENCPSLLKCRRFSVIYSVTTRGMPSHFLSLRKNTGKRYDCNKYCYGLYWRMTLFSQVPSREVRLYWVSENVCRQSGCCHHSHLSRRQSPSWSNHSLSRIAGPARPRRHRKGYPALQARNWY